MPTMPMSDDDEKPPTESAKPTPATKKDPKIGRKMECDRRKVITY
jgi:hypothetical protein